MASATPASARAGLDSEEYEDKVRFFSSFLHGKRDEWESKITKELANHRTRIPLELRDVEDHKPGLARQVLQNPVRYLLPWQEALMKFLGDINEKAAQQLRQELRLDIQGSFGRNHVTPRGMTSYTLHKMMCVEGIITKTCASEPKLIQSIHSRKSEDGQLVSRDQRDMTAFVEQPAGSGLPTMDAEGNELQMEIGLSVYKDQQKFILQEAPEQAPPGQIPRSIEIICDDELTDKAKPGDRVQVRGVYRGFPPTLQDVTAGVWPTRVIATSIKPIKEIVDSSFVSQDVKNIKAIAERADAFDLLARSVAPAICGHEKVKAGLLLQLVGGVEKNLENGTHLRGDINVLLVGDPSCGKSQMLRFVMNTAPLAVSTTGRGSSGVGLTAAMVRDPSTREFTLEAGAMVLADRGVICIDEFDKMGQADRVAIHEAMEQQCVTISKAGMHVSLNARCSVTAAANPIFGSFDATRTLAENIGLPDSLLSRFDLVFIVRDLTDEFIDKKIATQVLGQARQRNSDTVRRGVEQVHSSILERVQQAERQTNNQEGTEVFTKTADESEKKQEVLTVDFLRKYIRYCRRFTPVMSEEAQETVAKKYVDMRQRFQTGAPASNDESQKKKPRLAVTTRTLEAIIRLSTAHAKLKLRKEEVLPEDVEEAYKLMLLAREEEPVVLPGTEPLEADEPGPDDDSGAGGPDGPGGRKRAREGDGAEGAPDAKARAGELSTTRYRALETLVGRTFARMQVLDGVMQREELLESVNSELSAGEDPFTVEEFNLGLTRLESANKILVSDNGEIHMMS